MSLSEPHQPLVVIYERPMPQEEAIPERRWLWEVMMLTDGPRGKMHCGEISARNFHGPAACRWPHAVGLAVTLP